MAILNQNLISSYNGTSFSIIKPYNIPTLSFNNGNKVEDIDDYITVFGKELVNLSYNSILIGGLGLGLMAQWVAENTSCTTIDVLENNNELITWVSSSNYLNPKINIIEADVLTYTPNQTYDLIIMDLWWDCTNPYSTEEQTIKNTYSSKLNSSGSLYFPISPISLYPSGSF